MKKNNAIRAKAMKQGARTKLVITSLLIALCILGNTGSAQTDPAQAQVHDKSLKSYKLPRNVKKNFEDKYKEIFMVTSNLQETPQGPRGTLGISGHIKMKNVDMPVDKPGRTRAMAKAFLKDEAELLGFPDLNELREYKITTDNGYDGEYTHLLYDRYIDDLPLESATAHIVVGPDETITSVDVTLVPVPSELYQAVTKKRLTKEEASKLVEKDMKAQGKIKKVSIESAREAAISTAPYVVWYITIKQEEIRTINQPKEEWGYIIDSVTGDIVSKQKVRITIVD